MKVMRELRNNIQLFSALVKPKNSGYRHEIDGLRAISVLSVLYFHANFPIFSGGFVGIIFFVISGYLISKSISEEYKAKTYSFSGFYERRIRRIAPSFF